MPRGIGIYPGKADQDEVGRDMRTAAEARGDILVAGEIADAEEADIEANTPSPRVEGISYAEFQRRLSFWRSR